MKLLVCGGAGFIGSNYVRYVLNKRAEDSVVVLDKLTYAGNRANLADVSDDPRFEFVLGDIADARLVRDVIRDVDAVVNFAAETHVDRSILFPEEFIRTDIIGTFTLLEAVRDLNVPRYLQISTDEVYGYILDGKFTEKSPLDPSSPYSASKAGGDLLALAYYRTFGVPALVTRSSNNYGPYQYPEKVIPLFITNAMDDLPLPVYGDGRQVRDWLHVLDNCEAIDLVLREGEEGTVYNVGGDCELENIELTRAILAEMGKPESLIEFVEDRPGHDVRYALEIDRIKELGWEPSADFTEGLKDTIRWYIENEDWWRPLKDRAFREYYEKQYGER
jgi:dTDP-glucose 4,6-dehydratase